MLNQCPNSIGCVGSDFPISNFSSEAADVDVFLGFNWGWGLNIPPIGSDWSAAYCEGICESAVSQLDADQCAARLSVLCAMYQDGTSPGTGSGVGYPAIQPWQLGPKKDEIPTFGNSAQTCTTKCPDGTANPYTVSAGTYIARSQEEADAIAHSVACMLSNFNKICINDIDTAFCQDTVSSMNEQTVQLTAISFYPLTWSASGLPPGLECDDTGLIHGVPTVAGNFAVQVQATNTGGIVATKTINIGVFGLTIGNPGTIPTAKVDHPFNYTLMATGGTGDVIFEYGVDSFPGGITADSSGNITGTPVATGTYFIDVTIIDSSGNTCTPTVVFNVTGPKFNNTPTDGVVCTPYAFTVTTVEAGSTFSAGGLPSGLHMASNGAISGTPTSSGNYSVTVTATNGLNVNTKVFAINIPKPAAADAASVNDMQWTFSSTLDPQTSASGSASGGAGSITAIGACVGISSNRATGKIFSQVKNCSGAAYQISIAVSFAFSGGLCNGNPVIGEVVILINGSVVRDAPSLTGSGVVNLISPFTLANNSSATFEIDCSAGGNGSGSFGISITPGTPP